MEYLYLDDINHVYKSVSIDEVLELFSSLQTGLIFIGGYWCKNCQAIIKQLNNIVKMRDIDTIYNLDPRVKDDLGIVEDFRDSINLDFKMKFSTLCTEIGVNKEDVRVPFFVAVKNGHTEGFYSVELLYDNGILHYPESSIDQTLLFENEINKLIDLIK
jgi:hypothetical protein